MESKRFWLSKTVWVNGLVLVVGVLTYLSNHSVVVEYPQVVAALTAVVGAINVCLRFVSWKKVTV